jgi:tetratricopeptide (TPR) repeat protein
LKNKQVLLEKLKQKEALDNFFDKWFHDKTEGTLIAAFHPFANSAAFEEIFESHLSKLIKSRLPESAVSDKIPAIKPQWKEGSPFRGLSVFNFEHAPVFFGRTKAVSEIIDALRIQAASEKAFILILGMSGGGKSSLVRAGVLPMLTQPGVIEGVGLWRRAIMKPGDSPGDLFDGLAACLLQENALPELGADRTGSKELARILRETPKAAVPLIKGGLSQAASEMAKSEQLKEQPAARLVLVVDQMEEMFSLESITQEERIKFIEALDALSRSRRVWVIATLRSDFYPRTAELEGLVSLKEGAGQYDLLAPTPAEIGQMIRQPAQAAGLYFEEDTSTNERLDDILRDAAAKNPGALPLLEFTLEELYKQRTDNGMLTYQAYKKLGGVEGALAQRAEEVFGGLEPKVQQAMDVGLHALISIGVDDGERISRKYAPLEIVMATPETKAFVEAFVKARLFTTDLAADGSAIVNIAHEALLQHWPRLQDWIEKNRESLRIHARVNAAARRWENEKRSREFLLSAGKQVSEAEELVKNKNIELTETEKTFVHASIVKRKRIWWIKRAVAAVLVVLTIVASGAAYLAMQQRDRAKTEAQTAEQVSGFLVGLFEVSDPSEALGDTITAREILDKGAERIENELSDQPEVQATLMNTMGEVYVNLGLYDQALPLLENALSTRRQLFGGMHPDVAISLNNLGLMLYYKGNYSKAEELYNEALAIRQKIYGDEHPDVADNLSNLASLHKDKCDYSIAEEFNREALAIRRKIYGDEHPDVAQSLNNLGLLLWETGNDSIAEEMCRDALIIRRKIYGDEHPDVATSLNNLGLMLYYKGNYSKAEELYNEALAIRQKIYGDEHPRVATSLNNLAVLHKEKGNYSKAEELYKEALIIDRKIYGDEHPDVALSLNNLGVLLSEKGNYSKAEELYKEALTIDRKIYGDEHPRVANGLNNLGDLHYNKGNYSKAEEMYREALAIDRKIYGDEHPRVATSLNRLAVLYENKGDYIKAEELFKEALTIRRKIYGDEHPRVSTILNNLAVILINKGDYSEAETLVREGLAIMRNIYGDEHPRVALSLNILGYLHYKKGNYSKAEELFKEALAIRKKKLPENHWLIPYTMSYIGACLTKLKRFQEAETLLLESYPLLKEKRGADDKYTINALNRIIELYQTWDKPEKVAEYKALLPDTTAVSETQ